MPEEGRILPLIWVYDGDGWKKNYYFNGTDWNRGTVWVFDGSEWVQSIGIWIFNGTNWREGGDA